jgi:hypothetical protein
MEFGSQAENQSQSSTSDREADQSTTALRQPVIVQEWGVSGGLLVLSVLMTGELRL